MGDGFTVMGGILASVPGFGPSCYRGSVCVCVHSDVPHLNHAAL